MRVQELRHSFHRDLPPTIVWGFNGAYPGPTLLAQRDEEMAVTWLNDLRDTNIASQPLRQLHYLAVDSCVEGPSQFDAGPRVAPHVHGAAVGSSSDGHPLDAFMPGYNVTYVYPNAQPPATLWYHDHAMGITRLNVYMGLAGFYLIQDDSQVRQNDPQCSSFATLDSSVSPATGSPLLMNAPTDISSPSPSTLLTTHPSSAIVPSILPTKCWLRSLSIFDDVPIVIQDRLLNSKGGLSYPAKWQGMTLGNVLVANGKIAPVFEVQPLVYRLRILNGANSFVFSLSFRNKMHFHVIASDVGLMPTPLELNEITIAPGERYEIIIDFSRLNDVFNSTSASDINLTPNTTKGQGRAGEGRGEVVLENIRPAPHGHGSSLRTLLLFRLNTTSAKTATPSPASTLTIDASAPSPSVPSPHTSLSSSLPTPASILSILPINPRVAQLLPHAVANRSFIMSIGQATGECASPFLLNGQSFSDIHDIVVASSVEVWDFVNPTMHAHPMHVHNAVMYIMSRWSLPTDMHSNTGNMGGMGSPDHRGNKRNRRLNKQGRERPHRASKDREGRADMATSSPLLSSEPSPNFFSSGSSLSGSIATSSDTPSMSTIAALVSPSFHPTVAPSSIYQSTSPLVNITTTTATTTTSTSSFTITTTTTAATTTAVTTTTTTTTAFATAASAGISITAQSSQTSIRPSSPSQAIEAWEIGPKDTFIVWPGEAVRVLVQIQNYTGVYVLHCHSLDHEDNAMMIQFQVVSHSEKEQR